MKILITNSTGLVGSAFTRNDFFRNNSKFIHGSRHVDLTDRDNVKGFIGKMIQDGYKPDYVINIAGRVGGIKANTEKMLDFYLDNLNIGQNILSVCKDYEIANIYSFLSTCIYPDKVKYPLTEDQIHDGPPAESNFGYAYAKRMVAIQSKICKNSGLNYNCVIPNNLIGIEDNFNLDNSHVIPAIIRKIYEAKINNTRSVKFWGDGEALREFTFSDDIPNILKFLIESNNKEFMLNIGNTGEQKIRDVVNKITSILGYKGDIIWDGNKTLAGQFRKPSSNQKLLDLGWNNYTDFDLALNRVCDWFLKNYPNIRL